MGWLFAPQRVPAPHQLAASAGPRHSHLKLKRVALPTAQNQACRKPENNHVEANITPSMLWMSRGKPYILYSKPFPPNLSR